MLNRAKSPAERVYIFAFGVREDAGFHCIHLNFGVRDKYVKVWYCSFLSLLHHLFTNSNNTRAIFVKVE